MKEIFNRSRCCLSKLDRLRHELSRGIEAKDRELAKDDPSDRKLEAISRHIVRFGAELAEEERKAVRDWATA